MSEKFRYKQSGGFNFRNEPPLEEFYDALLPYLEAYGVTAKFPPNNPSTQTYTTGIEFDEWIGEPPHAVRYRRFQESLYSMGYDDKYLEAAALTHLETGETLSFKINITNDVPAQNPSGFWLTLYFEGEKTRIEAMRAAFEPIFIKYQFNSVELEIKPLVEESHLPEVLLKNRQAETVFPEQPARNPSFNFLMSAALSIIGIVLAVQTYSRLKLGGDFGRPELFFGTIALTFLSASLGLFVRAIKIVCQDKINKPQYEMIDRRMIPKLTSRIEIKYSRVPDVALACLVFFFGGVILFALFGSSIKPVNLVVVFLSLSILSVICFPVFRSKRKAVRLFDAGGVERGDGQRFSWQDFRGTVTRTGNTRYALKVVWRVELVFADGEEVWIISQRVKNYQEVFDFVNCLPTAVLKESS